MPRFSSRSLTQLVSCVEPLQRLFQFVVARYDCTVIEGHRDEATQNRYFDEGRSKVRYPDGAHNASPSEAADVVPYPIPENWAAFPLLTEDMPLAEIRAAVRDWSKDLARFYHFGGYVQGVADAQGVALRWGGDWDSDRDFKDQRFDDLAHFELRDRR